MSLTILLASLGLFTWAQDRPKPRGGVLSSTLHPAKQISGPAQIPWMGKQTPPPTGRSCTVTLQRRQITERNGEFHHLYNQFTPPL